MHDIFPMEIRKSQWMWFNWTIAERPLGRSNHLQTQSLLYFILSHSLYIFWSWSPPHQCILLKSNLLLHENHLYLPFQRDRCIIAYDSLVRHYTQPIIPFKFDSISFHFGSVFPYLQQQMIDTLGIDSQMICMRSIQTEPNDVRLTRLLIGKNHLNVDRS